jgi:hypothetical protein
MKSFSDGMTVETTVRSSVRGPDTNPGQGTGKVDNIVGRDTPVIVKTGATNNGGDNLPRRAGNR